MPCTAVRHPQYDRELKPTTLRAEPAEKDEYVIVVYDRTGKPTGLKARPIIKDNYGIVVGDREHKPTGVRTLLTWTELWEWIDFYGDEFGQPPFPPLVGIYPTCAEINAARAYLEALFPFFYQQGSGECEVIETAYTVPSIRVDAGLPGITWWRIPTGCPGGPTYAARLTCPGDTVFDAHGVELERILSQLHWVRITMYAYTRKKISPHAGGSNVDWDTSWSNTKTAYDGGAWANYLLSALAGFAAAARSPFAGLTYWHGIDHWRTDTIDFIIPNYNSRIIIPCAVFGVSASVWNGASGAIDIYPQANFGGTPNTHTVNATERKTVAVGIPTRNTTHSYSIRNNNYDADPSQHKPDPDNYRPPDADGAYDGFSLHNGGGGVKLYLYLDFGL